jgi:hypothetical protein
MDIQASLTMARLSHIRAGYSNQNQGIGALLRHPATQATVHLRLNVEHHVEKRG